MLHDSEEKTKCIPVVQETRLAENMTNGALSEAAKMVTHSQHLETFSTVFKVFTNGNNKNGIGKSKMNAKTKCE